MIELLFGVAQGSVLGPRLFKIYIRSLYKHIQSTKSNIEGFADDNQLIKQFMIKFQTTTLGELFKTYWYMDERLLLKIK